MKKPKDVSLKAFAKFLGRDNTAKLTFGDMLRFESYVTGYKPKKKEVKGNA